jgi:hypothetical protein
MLGASTTRMKAGEQAQRDEPRPTMNDVSHDGIITNVPAATCPRLTFLGLARGMRRNF